MSRSLKYWPEILLLLIFFGSRVAALPALPLHNDEGLHLTRAIEVWHLHPFYAIEDGKVIGVWVIALFYPQSAPVFAGRIATIFVSIVGLAAGMTLGRLASRRRSGGLLAGVFWVVCPYLFFFERMALADIETGAAVVLLTLFALPNLSRHRAALLAGIALGIALLFKVSAAPFAGVPLLGLLMANRLSWRDRVARLVVIFIVALIIVAPASLYSATRGGFFSIARGWVGSTSISERAAQNTTTFVDTTLTVDGLWVLVLIGVPLSLLAGRRGIYVFGCIAAPLVVLLLFGSEILDRHFGVLMPLMTVGAAIGWARLPIRLSIPDMRARRVIAVGATTLSLVWAWTWAWRIAYNDPANFPMTEAMREQYVADHPSGYALREAVEALPQTVGTQNVIGSMTSDGCKRARFYLPTGASLICTGMGTQSQPEIEKALHVQGHAYVLAEDKPVGIDPASIGGTWTSLAVYPRPGGITRVTLWRVTP